MHEFAKNEYPDFIYVSLDKDAEAAGIFDETKDPKVILERLSLVCGKAIRPGKTLIILDEIQECPNALGSLKYFNEDANEYHLITAGSLPGTYLAKPVSYPVGKVNLLNVYPLTFEEYLSAVDSGMHAYFTSIQSGKDYVSAFHERMLEHYRKYLIIGGMPECVQSWILNTDPEEVATIQGEIIELYENDFTKHSGEVNSGWIFRRGSALVLEIQSTSFRSFRSSFPDEVHSSIIGTCT